MVEWSSLAGALLDRAVRSDAGDDGEPDAEVAEAREALRAALLEPTPIAAVVSNAELDIGAAEVLAVAVTVEADPKLQRRLAQRHGDSMSTRLTVHDVAVLFVPDHDVLMAIGPDAPLRRAALVDVVGDGPWGAQSIVVHPTVMWAFAGEASVDPQLPPGTRVHEAPAGHPNADARTRFVAVTGEDRVRRLQAATAAAAATRYLVTPVPTDDAEWPALVREATLVGAGIVIELDGGFLPPVGRRWIERAAHLTWIVSSRTEVSIDEMPVRPWLDLVAPSTEPSREEWAETLGDTERTHRLTAAQLELVGRARAAGPGDLDTAVRRLAGGAIDTLARRVRPTRGWDDIVVSSDRLELLREIVNRSRHADAVFNEWGFQAVPSRGHVALFSGPSGTGKTLAAEIIAGELGLDLFKLDLSAVVSKYIGETEKNLDRVFDVARAGNVVLFFDEADALFGKRSEVKDARDRYANIEVSYLLQRLEAYDGLVVLATNFERNIDDAFLRRIHVRVEFALPKEVERKAIWEHNLPAQAPVGADVDSSFLARQFELTGGSIRNAALQAAFQAAAVGTEIDMRAVIRGVAREYQKLGRLLKPEEFAPFWGLVGRD